MRVTLGVEEDQLKLKIPYVCDARHLMRYRSSGEHVEVEKTVSVMLSF